ncbi:MAG: elongation factor G [Rhodospirillales bacterium]|nr:MAG: elongation factor G [Rhodospirillales bacterium]
MTAKPPSSPRAAALVGPYLSGKTTLLESILFRCGAITRKGSVREGNTVGDGSQEARDRQMSTELNVAAAEYLGERWTFIDCPGFIELAQDARNALMVVDTAVVVCEPEPAKGLTLAPLFRFLDQQEIPHMVFINKMDMPGTELSRTLEAIQAVSERPLVLREVPIREGEQITGFVDLVSERAFRWQQGKPSELIQVPEAVAEREQQARSDMLESLADFDDELLEKLLEDVVPATDDIYANLARDLRHDRIVPVFFGSAEGMHGVTRLLKALRHEAPEPQASAERLGVDPEGEPCARVFKSVHAAHTGKLSYVRVWRGEITDGMTLNGERVSGVGRPLGAKLEKVAKAGVGEVVALGRLDGAVTGSMPSPSGQVSAGTWPPPLSPLFALAVRAAQRSDEVKLTAALSRLSDEDPSLSYGHDPDTGELLLWGQGEMHLLVAIDRLRNRYNMTIDASRPQVPYKETIRASVSQHARHKKQSGGHGEFGDVHLDIRPLPRGGGFEFSDSITGGAVPKQYIPAVETGVRDYLQQGVLGFPVVDVAVTLTDGQFHTVDSSDMAFRKAGALAMREGMPKCSPVLLEPIFNVKVAIPTDFTSRVQRLVSGRRGQILGFEPKADWPGWDEVAVLLPQAEMHGLIVDLRSLTLGVGTFEWQFDHLQELSGRLADEVVAQRTEAS